MSQLALFDAPEAVLPSEVDAGPVAGEGVAEPAETVRDALASFDPLAVFEQATSPFRFALDAMGAAEEAIADATRSHPERADLLHRAFVCMRPRSDIFATLAPHATRAHMDELLRRIVADGAAADLAPGTATEVCAACAHISLAAPLKHDFAVVYHVAFIDAFGETQATATLGEETVRRAHMDREEHWKAEIYGELRHHMRDEDRGREWKQRALPTESETEPAYPQEDR